MKKFFHGNESHVHPSYPVLNLELFRPEYYKLSAEETIRTAKETTVEVVSKYFKI
ncbi:Inosose isomerase [Bacillus paralicheniformis]|nr:Inosose isomerase [Bacillus paralicheniformis]